MLHFLLKKNSFSKVDLSFKSSLILIVFKTLYFFKIKIIFTKLIIFNITSLDCSQHEEDRKLPDGHQSVQEQVGPQSRGHRR